MKKINARKLLASIEQKEAELESMLKDLKPGDLTKEGKKEIENTLERMIAMIESVKNKPLEV